MRDEPGMMTGLTGLGFFSDFLELSPRSLALRYTRTGFDWELGGKRSNRLERDAKKKRPNSTLMAL